MRAVMAGIPAALVLLRAHSQLDLTRWLRAVRARGGTILTEL